MPVLPTIIAGPCILQWNSFSYYFSAGLKVDYKRKTFQVQSNMHGVIDDRLESDTVTISGTPDGQVKSITKYFPYAVTDVGKSIFGIAAGGDTVVVWTKFGQKYTWSRGAMTKCPPLRLSPVQTLFGTVEFTCIGKAATQRTAADFWKTTAATAFADATFDETTIKTAIYTATYGAAPYDSIGSAGGFELTIDLDVVQIPAVDVGIAALQLRSIMGKAKFAPSNLTEAQVDTLMAMQGAGALQPGESVAKSNTDLVIASDAFTATLFKAGPTGYSMVYDTTKHQHEGIEFSSKRTWTAGAANPLWSMTVL